MSENGNFRSSFVNIFLLNEVFNEQITEYDKDKQGGSFWERSFKPRKRSNSVSKIRTKDDQDNAPIDQSESEGDSELDEKIKD